VQEGGEDVQGDDEAACIPHAVSFLFFRRQGSVHLACCPVFVSSFPPAGSPSPDVDEAACFPHAVSFSLLFSSTGRCAYCTPPCFHSFFLPGGPPPGRSTRRRASTRCLVIFLYFIDGGGTRPHSGSFPPLLGGFFFFPRLYCQRGRCMTHPPLSLRFTPVNYPPLVGGIILHAGIVARPPLSLRLPPQ
jgi:hypothetical protein